MIWEAPGEAVPRDRQILVCLDNRSVVLGSGASLPDRRQLGPRDVRQGRCRVEDEREGIAARSVESLVVNDLPSVLREWDGRVEMF